jgi:hypothetical protein
MPKPLIRFAENSKDRQQILEEKMLDPRLKTIFRKAAASKFYGRSLSTLLVRPSSIAHLQKSL